MSSQHPGLLKRQALSAWVWLSAATIIVGWTPLTGAVFVLTRPFDRQRRLTNRFFRMGGRLIARCHPSWHHHLEGTLPADVSQGYVIVCNHESHADSILISHLPMSARWLAKEEIMKIPFLGWMMGWAGDVAVRRGDKDSAKAAIGRLADELRRGNSVFLFPEGTRHSDGVMGEFKDGAFLLAIATGRPILPLVLTGCGAALPKGGWVLSGDRVDARLRVLEPVPTAGLSEADLPTLKATVRDRMIEARRALTADSPPA